MNERQLSNIGMSMAVEVYLGIFDIFPDLFQLLEDYKISSFYEDILLKDIDFTGNITCISASTEAARPLRIKLQERGLPCEEIRSEALTSAIKSSGDTIFILREADFKLAQEAVQDVLQDHAQEIEAEQEEDFELSRDDISSGEETDTSEEELEEESNTEVEEDVYEEDIYEEDSSNRKEQQKNKSTSARTVPTVQSNTPESYVENNDRVSTYEELEHIPETQPDYQDFDRRHDEYRRPDEIHPEPEPVISVPEEANYSGLANTGYDTSMEGNRDSHEDFDETSRPASINSSETLQEKESINRPHRAQQAGTSQSDLMKSGDWNTHSVETRDDKEATRATAQGNIQKDPGLATNINARKAAELRERSGSAEKRVGPRESLSYETFPSEVIRTEHREAECNIEVLATGSSRASYLSKAANEAVSDSRNTWYGGANPAHSFQNYQSSFKNQQNTGIETVTTNTFQTIHEREKKNFTIEIDKDISAKNIKLGKDGANKRIDNATNTYVNDTIIKVNRTAEIFKERHVHSIGCVLKSNHFNQVLSRGRRIVTQSMLPRESEAGNVLHNTADFASPIAQLMNRNLLARGAVAINRDVHCDLGVLSALYAMQKQISVEDARKEILNFAKEAVVFGGQGSSLNMSDMDKYMQSVGKAGFSDIIGRLNNKGFGSFLEKVQISNELKKALIGYPREQLNNPEVLTKLIKKFAGNKKDADFLKMVYGSAMKRRYRGGTIKSLFRRYLVQVFKRLARTSDAGKAGSDLYFAFRNFYSVYRSGLRLTSKILSKSKTMSPAANLLLKISDPGGTVKGQVLKLTNKGASLAKSQVKSAARKQLVHDPHANRLTRGFQSDIRRVRSKVNHGTSALGKLTGSINKSKLVTKVKAFTDKIAKLYAKAAAKVGVALGWIAVIAIVVILLLEVAESQQKKNQNSGSRSYNFAQDTEILQEVITELTAKNEAFMVEINNAANHRGSYAANTDFTANENVTYYEAYHVVFRDAYGNELEPTHVDLNNTKAIVSMASKFLPYPFIRLSDNASEEKKKIYEEIKQHFKDYCNFLWASTHQISIEEYHPGDDNYSAVDTSGLQTELATGKCDKDGTTIWLPADFMPNKVGSTVCEECSSLPGTGKGDMGNALCDHGKDANPIDGWRKTGRTVTHYNCPYGHTRGSEDEEWTDYCSSDYVYSSNHSHVCYEWVYECGGHMASVVYVTIGDLSRIPSFPAAKDVDYGAVAKYGSDDDAQDESESSSDPAEESSAGENSE